jgi:hypothetical protein
VVKVEFEGADGEVVATLEVAPAGIEKINDPADVVDFDAVTIGVHTGRRVSFDDDAEEWARSLPRVYRNAYLRAVVIDDDSPVSWQDQEPIEIEEPGLVGV